jgi:cytochrome b
MDGTAAQAPETEVIRLWDPWLRAFHWLLAALVAGSILTGLYGPLRMTAHFWLGYAIGALLVFRVVWGFVGPESARFARFLKGPGAVAAYAATLGDGKPSRWRGHSPLGGWAVVLLLGLVAAKVASGLMADPEDYLNRGPLARTVGIQTARAALAWHAWLGNVVIGMVGLHLAAVLFYAIAKGENLVGPMLWGFKQVRRDR